MPLHNAPHESPSRIPATEYLSRHGNAAVEYIRPMGWNSEAALRISFNGQYPEANLDYWIWASEHPAEQQMAQQPFYATPNFTPMGGDGASHMGAAAEVAARSVMTQFDMLTSDAVRLKDANA